MMIQRLHRCTGSGGLVAVQCSEIEAVMGMIVRRRESQASIENARQASSSRRPPH